jgi:sorting nexin-1/2
MQVMVHKAEQAAQITKDEYEIVNARVTRELDRQVLYAIKQQTRTLCDRFKMEKAGDMKKIMLNYVQLQLEYSKAMEQAWQDLLPKLQVRAHFRFNRFES